MKKYVRCKACGYIMRADRLHDKCPACGVSNKMFEEYIPNISEMRALILDSHIHPVIVHLPQALCTLALLLSATFVLFPSGISDKLFAAIQVVSAILPFVTLGAIASGIFDGIIRFRKVTTQILIKKLIYGSLFFIFSSAMFVLALFFDVRSAPIFFFYLACNILCFISSIFLGRLGSSILNSKFPG